jgi:phosphatidylglycerophosphatase A
MGQRRRMAYHGRMDSNAPTSAAGPRAPRLAWWLATGLGSGHLRPAPGTWGSLAGLLAWVLLVRGLGILAAPWTAWVLLAAPLALTLLAVWAADAVVKETGLKDPSWIVIDEWAGVWFALTPLLFTVTVQPQPWLLWAARLTARSCCSGSSISGSPAPWTRPSACPVAGAWCWTMCWRESSQR